MDRSTGPVVVLLVGLPGVGKTQLARSLAPEIGAVVLNRDQIRDAIFPELYLDYSAEQNEVATATLLNVLDYLLAKPRPRFVILDGKPFSRRDEIAAVKARVDAHAAELVILHCVATPEVIADRLRSDLADPRNVRAQRNPEKAARISDAFQQIDLPHVTIDTTRPTDVVLRDCVSHIAALTGRPSP